MEVGFEPAAAAPDRREADLVHQSFDQPYAPAAHPLQQRFLEFVPVETPTLVFDREPHESRIEVDGHGVMVPRMSISVPHDIGGRFADRHLDVDCPIRIHAELPKDVVMDPAAKEHRRRPIRQLQLDP